MTLSPEVADWLATPGIPVGPLRPSRYPALKVLRRLLDNMDGWTVAYHVSPPGLEVDVVDGSNRWTQVVIPDSGETPACIHPDGDL
jgi:hypothetical protein